MEEGCGCLIGTIFLGILIGLLILTVKIVLSVTFWKVILWIIGIFFGLCLLFYIWCDYIEPRLKKNKNKNDNNDER